jgi:hypothetical protein
MVLSASGFLISFYTSILLRAIRVANRVHWRQKVQGISDNQTQRTRRTFLKLDPRSPRIAE